MPDSLPVDATRVAGNEDENEYEGDEYDEDDVMGFDEIEASLLQEDFSPNISTGGGAVFKKKINLSSISTGVQNDIDRSEKKGEKRSSHYGKDDRATSEQVMDPRTRLILFKLLSNGFLTEIDGKFLSRKNGTFRNLQQSHLHISLSLSH